jgi:hypothetical protein
MNPTTFHNALSDAVSEYLLPTLLLAVVLIFAKPILIRIVKALRGKSID